MPCTFHQSCELPSLTRLIYKYGIILASIGVVLNWMGVSQPYLEPVKYVGIALIVTGSALIMTAMCRWMYRPIDRTDLNVNSVNMEDLHVITVPLNIGAGPSHPQLPIIKPPEYCFAIDKPPSYNEAVAITSCASNLNGETDTRDVSTYVNLDQIMYYVPSVQVQEPQSNLPSTPPPQYRSTECIGAVCDSNISLDCREDREISMIREL